MMTEIIKKVSKKRGAEKNFTPFLKEQITDYLPMHLSQFRIF
jgi:predicted DNA-binding ribbon-helix-helix protein